MHQTAVLRAFFDPFALDAPEALLLRNGLGNPDLSAAVRAAVLLS